MKGNSTLGLAGLVRLVSSALSCWLVVIMAAGAGAAQGAPDFKDSYELRDYEIPMRDGVTLYTVVVAPRDKSKTYPILLSSSPYGAHPQGPEDVNSLYAKAGYIFVSQDARGRNKSGGVFLRVAPLHSPGQTGVVDPSTDAYDTVDWLLNNIPDNNGRVGLKGLWLVPIKM